MAGLTDPLLSVDIRYQQSTIIDDYLLVLCFVKEHLQNDNFMFLSKNVTSQDMWIEENSLKIFSPIHKIASRVRHDQIEEAPDFLYVETLGDWHLRSVKMSSLFRVVYGWIASYAAQHRKSLSITQFQAWGWCTFYIHMLSGLWVIIWA